NNRAKIYGQTVTFLGTEFTTNGLASGDSVTSVTLTSAGAAATATVAGSPYSIVPSAAVGTGLSNYNITYVNGSLTVTAASTSTALTSSKNPSCFGDSVTFTATVTDTSSGSTGTPSGTVTFKDGTSTLGTGHLNGSGVTTFSITTLSAGSPT